MIKSLSTVDTFLGPGLLHPFPNQQWSGDGLPIDRSPLITDQGSLMGCYLLVLFKIKSLVICFCKISHTKFPNNTI